MSNAVLPKSLSELTQAQSEAEFQARYFSDLHAFVNILQVLLGYATLTMPYAYYHCSYTFIFAAVLLPLNLIHLNFLMGDVQFVREAADLEGRLTLGGFFAVAIQLGPKPSKQLALGLHIAVDLLMGIGCLLMASCCLAMAFRQMPVLAAMHRIQLDDSPDTNELYFLLFGALVALPCCWLRDLNYVSVFSALGVIFVGMGVWWSLWYKWDMSLLYTEEELAARPMHSSELVFVGLAMYASMPVAALLPVENALQANSAHVHDKPWLMSWAMVFALIFNTITGFLGYAFMGPTLVADYFTGFVLDHLGSWCGMLCCMVGVFFSFVLQFYLLFDLMRFRPMHVMIEFGLRTLVMLICIGLAFVLRTVPVEQVLCGLGVLCVPLGLTVPSVSHLLLFFDEATRLTYAGFALATLAQIGLFVAGLIGFVGF